MAPVTVCVPAYNAAAFIAETLDSVLAQTFGDLKVLISLDRSTDDSEAICRRYLSDQRFTLITQPERQGWVGNVNALIRRVDTPFFCILPHDDLLDPRYIAESHAVVSSSPRIVCAYSDIEGFGTLNIRLDQPDIRGSRLERVTDFFLNHFGAVAFRGVTRLDPSDPPLLPTGTTRNFAADTVWLLELAIRGEQRRVPELLYRKRYSTRSVHADWFRWPRDERIALWAEQAAVCARIALARFSDPGERRAVLAAAVMRLTGASNPAAFFGPDEPVEVAIATATFCEAMRDVFSASDIGEILTPATVTQLYRAARTPWRRPPPDPPAPERLVRQMVGHVRRALNRVF
jgi:glycosyltransferase involved in cell wall biosynthesis